MSSYAFGRDEIAIDRLRLLHEVFEASSHALLNDLADAGETAVALDLGCGPGFTTGLVMDTIRPLTMYGLDVAPAFLAYARAHRPTAQFVEHDLTALPFPGSRADLVYQRYVIAHLPHPSERLREWAGQLNPGGLLVMEENDSILADQPVFRRYLEFSAMAIASHGGDQYIGGRLDPAASGFDVLLDRVVPVTATTGLVARMFSLNLGSWRNNPALSGHADELDQLGQDLERLQASSEGGEITWRMRQVVARSPTVT